MRRIGCLLLCILLVFPSLGGCVRFSEPSEPTQPVSPVPPKPYPLGLQTEQNGYVRLSFATLGSYTWQRRDGSQKSNDAADVASDHAHLTKISASHTEGSVALNLAESAQSCTVTRWPVAYPEHAQSVELQHGRISLHSDGGVYIYEIQVSYLQGQAAYFFMEVA